MSPLPKALNSEFCLVPTHLTFGDSVQTLIQLPYLTKLLVSQLRTHSQPNCPSFIGGSSSNLSGTPHLTPSIALATPEASSVHVCTHCHSICGVLPREIVIVEPSAPTHPNEMKTACVPPITLISVVSKLFSTEDLFYSNKMSTRTSVLIDIFNNH